MSRLPEPTGARIDRPHYVIVGSPTVRNPRLSYRALGLLTYLLDQKEGWVVRSEQLCQGEGREGRAAVRTALRELATEGHYRLERRHLLNGKMAMGTAISEAPKQQWVKDNDLFGSKRDPAVPVVQQPDGTFLVQYPDGTFGPDGFESGLAEGRPVVPEEEPEAEGQSAPKEGASAAPPKSARTRRNAVQKAAADQAKSDAAEQKAAEKKGLDAAAEEVASWWWGDAQGNFGPYVGKTNGYVAMRGMVRRALVKGYTQRNCADALRHARQYLPSAQQWQNALGVATGNIVPAQRSGRIAYSDEATWGHRGEGSPVPGSPEAPHPTPADDSDDATFGVRARP
ncbi:hypothetical protein ACFWCA_19650 [Streptomyces phaeochromogenes]|uniref:hypothetical protein n=1 Tax=Streptomyces phaeochromogenes TaxID=1923 RepID=UPI0036BA15E7